MKARVVRARPSMNESCHKYLKRSFPFLAAGVFTFFFLTAVFSQATFSNTSADLSITKSSLSDPIIAGDSLTYSINISNAGPSDAVNVVVTETYEAGFLFLSSTPSPDSGTTNRWTFKTIKAGDSKTIKTTGIVDPLASGTLRNLVTAASTTSDPDVRNNSFTETSTVDALASVIIEKSDSADPIVAGGPLTYIITLTNRGPSTALDMEVKDIFPTGVSYLSDTAGITYKIEGDGSYLWKFKDVSAGLTGLTDEDEDTFADDLAPDASFSFSVTVQVDPSLTGTLTNTASVGSFTPLVKSGATTTEATTVSASADLSITKSSLSDASIAGESLTYSIDIVNSGPSDAQNVVITENYDANFIFSSSSPSPDRRTTNRWTFKTIKAGDSETISITGTTKASTLGSLSNEVSLTSDTADKDPSNNTFTLSSNIESSADLSIEKSGPSVGTAGEEITYTLNITNSGPSDALKVTVTDPVPSGTEYVADSSKGTYDPAGGIWTVGTLKKASSSSIDITLRILSDTKGSITDKAAVSSSTPDKDSSNNKASLTTSIETSSDISITKSSLSDASIAGESLTYSIDIVNSGPSDAQNILITENYDANFIFSSSSPSPDRGKTNRWTFKTIKAGDSETISITGTTKASTLGSLSNEVSLTSDTADKDPSNNTFTLDTNIESSADISIEKSGPSVGTAGEEITYTLNITNSGPSDALKVRVNDSVPSGTEYVADSSKGTYDPAGGIWTVGTLKKASSSSIDITLRILSDTKGSITDKAEVSSSTPDKDSSNNKASLTTSVETSSDISVTKSSLSDASIAGESLTYSIDIVNSGPSDAQNILITENYDANFIFSSSSPSPDRGKTNRWTFKTIKAGDSETISITGTTKASTLGSLSNEVSLTSDTADKDPSNNTFTLSSNIETSADISIEKSGPSVGTAGENITYTLNITNSGPSDAQNVVVSDTLPAGLLNPEYSLDAGATWSNWTGSVSLDTLAFATSKEISITGMIDSSVLGTLSNNATISSDTADKDPSNNTFTLDTSIESSADLSIEKSGPSVGTAGEEITYTLNITNSGPSDALKVTVTDPVPSGTEYVTDSSKGTYDPAGGIWTVGTLKKASSSSIDITLRILSDTKGSITDKAAVSSSTPDKDSSNNKASLTTSIETSSDISITKSSLSDASIAGESLTYSIDIVNSGPSDAQNILITENYDANFIFSSSSPSPDRGKTNRWTFKTIKAGDSETISITGTTKASTLGSLSNEVSLTSDTADKDPSNNTFTLDTNIESSADISIEKSGPSVGTAGEEITYTLNITNSGPSDALKVRVNDSVPSGTEYVADSSKGTYDPAGGIWTVGTLKKASSSSIDITLRILSDTKGSITDKAEVSSSTPDKDSSNNKASLTTSVETSSDISVTKSSLSDASIAGESLTYSIDIVNSGPSDAQNILITENYDANFIFSSSSPSPDRRTTNRWTFKTIKAGDSETISITGTTKASTLGSLSNEVSLTSDTADKDPSNNTFTLSSNIETSADISIEKSGPSVGTAGENITYTLNITNSGPSDAQNVVVSDTLPAGLLNPEYSLDAGATWSNWTGSVSLDTLAFATSKEISITGMIDSSVLGTLSNSATISSDTADKDPSNNTFTLDTSIESSADISITKSSLSDPIIAGESLTYIINIMNSGPSDAVNVVIIENYDANFIFSSSSLSPDRGTTNRWTFKTIKAGDSETISITGTTKASTLGSLSNEVTLTSDTADPDPDNNSTDLSSSVLNRLSS